MPTPNGSSTAYIAPSDILNYRDVRQVGDWASADDARVSAADLLTNAIVLDHCSSASGEFESAVLRGGRYDLADLQALTGVSLRYAVKVMCWIAIDSLSDRKPRTKIDDKNITWARDQLTALAQGERVLAIEEAASDAFMAEAEDMAPANTVFEDDRVSVQADRLFGNRSCER